MEGCPYIYSGGKVKTGGHAPFEVFWREILAVTKMHRMQPLLQTRDEPPEKDGPKPPRFGAGRPQIGSVWTETLPECVGLGVSFVSSGGSLKSDFV